ncbi:T-cell activation Rho GTPase activating protein, putative [Entamoeba invadens IP1]|uniref:T-cell activation Rho GTPase activating protein, putative n=1 Tax=Entamoeba invadens IP1 TaxID=370355 RepID=A0A0A1TVW3_ENTIV|nr:T-cell activation Rho GTPase activating protein, putative [Entamoeba invadens IP1]ELP84632.1 T-cell activation Rho GTPase activating protein, putative [Entamoeba invadens IP1]|eukprot:XP_004183978.1 T-cell activation Rho GTPase activating protein, putative [Entamoeba invadens IP1]
MSTERIISNQLIAIGESKYKEFTVLNNFWTKQHVFIKEWSSTLERMNSLLQNEIQLIESTFYNNTIGFCPDDGEVIISALSYINNTISIFANESKENFTKVLDSLDVKFNEIESEFKSAGYSEKSKGEEANEKIVTLWHSLESMATVNITKMFSDFLDEFDNYFKMGITFIEESDRFKVMKESFKKRLKDEEFKQHTLVNYAQVPIHVILEHEQRTKRDLPKAVEQIHLHLTKNGLNVKGIFRESGATAHYLQELYMRMSVTNFLEIPPDITAAVYKKFLREIPGHIFNTSQTTNLVEKMSFSKTDKEMNEIDILKSALEQLPEELNTLFTHLLRLCFKIAQNEKINSMGSKNLAVCLTPSVFSIPEGETGQFMLPSLLGIMTLFINNFSTLFPRFADPTLAFANGSKSIAEKRERAATVSVSQQQTSQVPRIVQQQKRHVLERPSDVAFLSLDPPSVPKRPPTMQIGFKKEGKPKVGETKESEKQQKLNKSDGTKLENTKIQAIKIEKHKEEKRDEPELKKNLNKSDPPPKFENLEKSDKVEIAEIAHSENSTQLEKPKQKPLPPSRKAPPPSKSPKFTRQTLNPKALEDDGSELMELLSKRREKSHID